MANTPPTGTERILSAKLIDNAYWLAGIWDADGTLLWSSEPDSYDSAAEATEAARIRNLTLVRQP